jgi:hypothetical protein
VSAWLLTFTISLDDVVLSAFLSGPGATTMPLVIFSRARLGLNPSVNAVATLIVVASWPSASSSPATDRPRRTPPRPGDGRRRARLTHTPTDTPRRTPMKLLAPTALALALASAFPALAQSNADLLKELQALKDRCTELEKKLQGRAGKRRRPPASGA